MLKAPEPQAPVQTKLSGQRRTERLKLSIPIRVMCFGGSAGDFTEDTNTLVVNRDGALIILEHRVTADDTLRIINLENFHEADFRVVGQTRYEGQQVAEWGVECLEKDRVIWGIEFPPPLDPGSSQAGALLQCLECKKQRFAVLNLVEVDMLESVGKLEKLCEQCGHLSTWSYADVTRRPKQLPPSEQPAASPRVGEWDGKTERRLHKRMALKLRALIRNSKGETEMAKTENLSRGGMAICLKMTLSLGEFVTVICPYSGGGQDIEQRAEVRYKAPHIAGQNWFYGFVYRPR
jgi:hypothetical protein